MDQEKPEVDYASPLVNRSYANLGLAQAYREAKKLTLTEAKMYSLY